MEVLGDSAGRSDEVVPEAPELAGSGFDAGAPEYSAGADRDPSVIRYVTSTDNKIIYLFNIFSSSNF